MFDIGFGEFAVIAVIALFVIGPERLPGAAAQAGRVLRELREMATGARRELTEHLDLDPELASLDLTSLDPRDMVRRTLLDENGGAANGGASNGGASNGHGSTRPRAAQRPVGPDERPPYDPDAT